MKYIITKTNCGLPAAICFNEALTHRDVAKPFPVITGAGFCNADGDVWGHSESLDIGSKPEDATHVKLALNFNLTPKPSAA